jgi:hypothetical protein
MVITKRDYTAGRLLESAFNEEPDPFWSALDALLAADVMLPLLGH